MIFAGEQSQAGQSLNPEKENNSQLESTLTSQLEKTAVQINSERLKFIDELSRLISELKNHFPELAEHLSKARDYISVNQENIPVKKMINLLNVIQQNLNIFANAEKPEIAETIKKLVSEAIKILQPNSEIPAENKLILALSKNDFASANAAIKNIVAAPPATPLLTTQTPSQASSQQTFQIIFNALQELKELGIPKELQNAPLKELEAIALQKSGIDIPKDSVKNLSAVLGEKPVFSTVNLVPVQQQTELQQPGHTWDSGQIQELRPTHKFIPATSHIYIHTHKNTTLEIPLPKNFPLQIPSGQKIEMALSLYQIPNQAEETKFILQPWTASIALPKEERNFWLKTDLPLTPQILNIREAILSFGKLPENPEFARLFANGMHELSLLTEHGVSVSKEQTNLLWRVVQTMANEQRPVASEQRPVANEQRPVASEQRPVASEQKPVANEQRPVTNEQKSVANEQRPVASEQKPVASEQRPVANEQRPVASEQRPVANEQRPVASEQRPVVANEQRPVASEQRPVPSKEGTAAGGQWLVVSEQKHLPVQITQTLLKYQPLGNYEGDLFKNLPEPVKRELLQELPAGKIWQPETLQKAVEKILEKYIEQPGTANLNENASKTHEEIRNTLQNLKEQIQWTRIDQDTRPQNDRENIFYFMHNNELQKGRLKVKDERKNSSKKQQDSSVSFTIETRTKNLGEVHADLVLSKGILNIRLRDEFGTAGTAVIEERETLAKELIDIGITLGELLYGKTPKIQNLPVTKKEKSSGGLDVMA